MNKEQYHPARRNYSVIGFVPYTASILAVKGWRSDEIYNLGIGLDQFGTDNLLPEERTALLLHAVGETQIDPKKILPLPPVGDSYTKSVRLSQHPSYTGGKKKIEVMTSTPDSIEQKPTFYFQIVDGCGYDVYHLTPDEADQIADALKTAAGMQRKLHGMAPNFIHEIKITDGPHAIRGRGTVYTASQKENPNIDFEEITGDSFIIDGQTRTVTGLEWSDQNGQTADHVGLVCRPID